MSPRILYLSLNGIREPLVWSQVLAYMDGLHRLDYEFTLVTFEPQPISAADEVDLRERLMRMGVEWRWVLRSRGMGPLSLAIDIFRGYVISQRIIRSGPIALVHARSFVPAVIAAMLKSTTAIPFIYDTRGFWVDEKVYKGSLRANGLMYHTGKRVEGWCFRKSDAIVMLADRGRRALSDFRCFRKSPLPHTVVIPTCVDLKRFTLRSTDRGSSIVCGYVGSLSQEYLPDKIIEFFSVVLREFPGSTLRLVTRTDPAPIWRLVDAAGISRTAVVIAPASPDEVADATKAFDVGLCFIRPHFSKMASCPTKVGEYLAAGVPVVANTGIGDLDELLAQEDVGIVLDDLTRETMKASMQVLRERLARPTLNGACRRVAETHFSIDEGIASYAALYGEVLANTKS